MQRESKQNYTPYLKDMSVSRLCTCCAKQPTPHQSSEVMLFSKWFVQSEETGSHLRIWKFFFLGTLKTPVKSLENYCSEIERLEKKKSGGKGKQSPKNGRQSSEQ